MHGHVFVMSFDGSNKYNYDKNKHNTETNEPVHEQTQQFGFPTRSDPDQAVLQILDLESRTRGTVPSMYRKQRR